ncbi:unnamed protein product [Adineta ricciae]|uniref:Uncharacterized protein n=1 Tax=Adineta ricciae TaxID=249248 RepID=A0A814W0A6_ADIRI|nr:unnamed protein product [Adineta ricciae]
MTEEFVAYFLFWLIHLNDSKASRYNVCDEMYEILLDLSTCSSQRKSQIKLNNCYGIQPDNNSRSLSEQPANAPSPPCHFRFTPSNLDLFASAGGDTQVDRYPFDQSGVAGECGGSPKICVLKLMKSVVQCPICGTSIYKNCVGAVISKKDSQQIVLDILCAVQHEGVKVMFYTKEITTYNILRSTNPTLDPTIRRNPIGFLATESHRIPTGKIQSFVANFMSVIFS